MLSMISNLMVEDLGPHGLHELEGLKAASFLKPMSVMITKRPRALQFFSKKQHQAYNILVHDVLEGDNEALSKIQINSKELKGYQKEQQLDVDLGGKASLEIFTKLPQIKAEATAAGGVTVKLKTNGLTLKSVDDTAFEKLFRDRKLDKKHSLIAQFLRKQRRTFCVITSVLESTGDTVIECTSKSTRAANLSAEVNGQGLSANLSVTNNKSGSFTFPPGTVLACSWIQMNVNPETYQIEKDYFASMGKGDPVFMMAKMVVEERILDFKVQEALDQPLQKLSELSEEDLASLRSSFRTIMDSPADIDNLSDVFEEHDGPDHSTCLPVHQLQNPEAFEKILAFAGFSRQGDEIKWSSHDKPLSKLAPILSDALTCFESQELQLIKNCKTTQKDVVVDLIKASVNPALEKSLDIDVIRKKMQVSPLAEILSILDMDYDTLWIPKSQKMEYVYYLLQCLL